MSYCADMMECDECEVFGHDVCGCCGWTDDYDDDDDDEGGEA
jgi:hypothetical protein